MASLTPGDRAFIDNNPLPPDLHTFVSELDLQDEPNANDAITNLLATFLTHPVARRLRSPYRPVNGELITIYGRLQSDTLDLSLFTPLTTLVANKAGDVDIWQAVLDLILIISRTSPSSTPLQSIPLSFNGTPSTHSSASFRDSEQTRQELEEPVRRELASCTYTNVGGFFSKFFENGSCSNKVDRLLNRVNEDAALHSFPKKAQPEEEDVWKWLDEFQRKYLTDAPGVYYQSKSKTDIRDAQGQRQLDIFLKNRSVSVEEGPHSLRDIQVIGELTKSPKKNVWRKKYVQLAIYVRDLFAAQPTRWFVHGFLMFGSQMELWVFDRSGAYGSQTFDACQHSHRFIQVIAGYAMMSSSELGLSPIVKRDGQHKNVTITVTDATTRKDREVQLKPTPFVSHHAIVCRGTTCFLTHDVSKVVKLSWRPDKLRSEIDLLIMAEGVKGIPRLVGYKTVTTIKDLRSDLDITVKKDLGHELPERSTDSLTSSFASQSTHAISELDTSRTKRKSHSIDELPSKKRRMSNLRQVVRADNIGLSAKQSTVRVESSSTQCSPYKNRVLTCLVIAPAGRPLQSFRSVLEVLQAFRDTISAHRSLFLERNILHRDISTNNIILTDPTQNDGCTGMLIDLDLAVVVGLDGKNETSQERNMTGTLEYMAIQILDNATQTETAGIEHTYRHDLESFFYVFLSLCVRYGRVSDQTYGLNKLKAWHTGDPDLIARVKRGDMEPGGFEARVVPAFSPYFHSLKELARRLRRILFGAGALYLGTPEKPASLYDPMIQAFETAIRDTK